VERIHALGARNAQVVLEKRYEPTGTIDGVFYSSRLLALTMGNWATTGSSPYTHTLTEANFLNSFTLEASLGSVAAQSVLRRYAGCIINNFKLTAGIDTPCKFSADFMAKQVSYTELGTPATPVFDTNTTPALGPQFAKLQIDGSNNVNQVQDLDFTISNNLEYIPALGSRLFQAQVGKTRTYEVRARVAFNQASPVAAGDTVLETLRRFMGTTSSPDTPQTSVGEVNGGKIILDNGLATSAENTLTINLNGFKITDYNIETPIDGLVMLDFTAYYRGVATNITHVDGIAQGSYLNGGADLTGN